MSFHSLTTFLACPSCGASNWQASGTDDRGALACHECAATFSVTNGVLDLGESTEDAQVAAERAAVHDTERQPDLGGINDAFDDLANATGELHDALCALPWGNTSRYYREPGYFTNVQASVPAFDFLLDHIDLTPGRRALDLGADITWSTCQLARHGLDSTAVDINHHLAVGRLLGRHFGVDYQLVRTDMRTVPFKPASFDLVMAVSALHHNPELTGIVGHIGRLLRPGGQLAVIEPYCATAEQKAAFGRDQIAAGISEQTYLPEEWHDAFVDAGLTVQALRVCESFCAVYRKRRENEPEPPRGRAGLFADAYRGRLRPNDDVDLRVTAGTPATVRVTIKNSSHAVWSSHSQFPVHVSYHLYRSQQDGDTLVAWDNVRTPLPGPLGPGESVELDVNIAGVGEPGLYTLALDLVHEYITWFTPQAFESPAPVFLRVAGP
jgi:SAM-dependent methyltransferase